MDQKIDICKKTRLIASRSFANTLRELLSNEKPVSEEVFRNKWLIELRKNQAIYPDGWYIPPPHGIGVLFGADEENSRVNYKSLRPEKMWPKGNIFLEGKNEMAYIFASPVDKKYGIIGDFGLTVYLGDNLAVKNYLRKCWKINLEIFNFIQVRMKFSEVYKFAKRVIAKYGLTNQVISSADPTGEDIGHTVPASYFEWSAEEKLILERGITNWESASNMISRKRVFINSIEETTFQTGMAVTLEPRLTVPNNPAIPMGSFHTIVIINADGKKELLSNFDEIFRIVGMDYMVNLN